MAGLIVAGYDAVHKQGQVFKWSKNDCIVLFANPLLIDMLLF